MTIARLEDVEVGEAIPVGIRGTAADLVSMTGATVTGRISLNGAAATEVEGQLFDDPDADGFVGVVPFPGALITAAGKVEGTVTVTLEGEVWSPRIVRFIASVKAHV